MIASCKHCGELVSTGLPETLLIDETRNVAEFARLGDAMVRHCHAHHQDVLLHALSVSTLVLHQIVVDRSVQSSDPLAVPVLEYASKHLRDVLTQVLPVPVMPELSGPALD